MNNLFDSFSWSYSTPEEHFGMMIAIRKFEEKLLDQFSKGKISGTTHTCIGQEANAVSLMSVIDRDLDTVWSNHRCHGHFLAYCGEAYRLFAEILGKKDGICAGRGGSQHLAFKNFFSSGIQGGLSPIGVGTALANKDDGAITVVFLGDGTMGQGAVYEALNMASLWDAPVLFVIEDNGIAQTTEKANAVSGAINQRASAFGVASHTIRSTNINQLLAVATEAVSFVRSQRKPFWLHIETDRLAAHSKGDDTREKEDIASLWHNDCVKQAAKIVPNSEEIERTISSHIEDLFEQARACRGA